MIKAAKIKMLLPVMFIFQHGDPWLIIMTPISLSAALDIGFKSHTD